MLVLSKKRILLMLCMVFISLYAFSFKIAIQNSETIETVAVPSSSRVIVIDAGHGTPDEGGSLLHQVKNRSNYFFIKKLIKNSTKFSESVV